MSFRMIGYMAVFAFAIALFVMACIVYFEANLSDGNPKQNLLQNDWKVKNVTLNGVDQTSLYSDMILRFSETEFSASPAKPLWPASGTWAYSNPSASSIKRDDNLIINIQDISNASMQLTLTVPLTESDTNGQISTPGFYTFSFISKTNWIRHLWYYRVR